MITKIKEKFKRMIAQTKEVGFLTASSFVILEKVSSFSAGAKAADKVNGGFTQFVNEWKTTIYFVLFLAMLGGGIAFVVSRKNGKETLSRVMVGIMITIIILAIGLQMITETAGYFA